MHVLARFQLLFRNVCWAIITIVCYDRYISVMMTVTNRLRAVVSDIAVGMDTGYDSYIRNRLQLRYTACFKP